MTESILSTFAASIAAAWFVIGTPRVRRIVCTVLGLMLVMSLAAYAQPSTSADAKAFFKSIVGEWIGTCEQSTDGEQAQNKYFHAVVKQVDGDTFSAEFDYYRADPRTGAPQKAGTATMVTSIDADGTIRNKINGQGSMLVNNKPKNQRHELVETLTPAGSGMKGTGSGKISVSGMPLGLGKNGKVNNSRSAWSLNNGVLRIDQSLKAGFRALVFKKTFAVEAHYTAKRGSDVAGLIRHEAKVAQRP